MLFQSKGNEMQKLLMFFSVLSVALITALSAQALPAATSTSGVTASKSTIFVSGGCGRHRHRGPHGHCRWN
jgi:hypothetical protein